MTHSLPPFLLNPSLLAVNASPRPKLRALKTLEVWKTPGAGVFALAEIPHFLVLTTS
jgi:hypothetical protein